MRPTHVIADSSHEEAAVHTVTPPEFISAEAWGEAIYVVIHQDGQHYEGTEIIPKPVKSDEAQPSVKNEP